MSLEHAEHNEALCHKLFAEGSWNDWVVTTAFYAAIHFLEQRLFPLKLKQAEYASFDEYYPSRIDGSRTQHACRDRLVYDRLRKAHAAYRFLFDSCRTARYYDYGTTHAIAEAARLKLAVVKSLCVAVKAPMAPPSIATPSPLPQNN